uniref:CSON015249 protein n=1 Tax=Culicoides sonorensis TaxID=179676 RepID=A0A336LPE3_CULSO
MKLATLDKISAFLAELIGTGLITFAGCMGCVALDKMNPPSHLQICLGFGLVVMFVIQIFGAVSGAHLNPAVTAAAFVYKIIDIKMSVIYVVGQCIGGFMGFGLLKLVTPSFAFERPEGHAGVCTTVPAAQINDFQAVVVEFMATAVLILVCCGVWDPRNAKNSDSIPLRFGFTIAALALVAGPYTGCSMNPARSLGPAIWNQDFQGHWIYWVGPMLAGLLVTYVYKIVFYRDVPKEKPRQLEEYPLSEKNAA